MTFTLFFSYLGAICSHVYIKLDRIRYYSKNGKKNTLGMISGFANIIFCVGTISFCNLELLLNNMKLQDGPRNFHWFLDLGAQLGYIVTPCQDEAQVVTLPCIHKKEGVLHPLNFSALSTETYLQKFL